MSYVLHIVTGAPGAGKTTAAECFLQLRSADFVAFDIDWLAESASNLARKDIFTDESTWKPYGELWFEVLHCVHRNWKIPVLFAPIGPSDIEKYGKPAWCKCIEWFLLDCDDETRRERLAKRRNWSTSDIEEALADAASLRQQDIRRKLDTGRVSPTQVASAIHEWLKCGNRGTAGLA